MEVRKTVTVVFADVTGSTALGERLDPESMRGVMSRYFDEMRSAVERLYRSVHDHDPDAFVDMMRRGHEYLRVRQAALGQAAG